jgi:hypothetical protein
MKLEAGKIVARETPFPLGRLMEENPEHFGPENI